MASSFAQNMLSFKAGGVITAYTAVKIGSDAQHVQAASAASDKMLGIAQGAATAAEDTVEVAMPGGGAKMKLGGTVAAGDMLTSDASGYGVATTTNADKVIAQAQSAGVSGDVIGVAVIAGIV
jgi:hypothetical protein